MEIVALSLTYKRAPVALRERLAFQPTGLGQSLEAMKRYVPEGAIVSTCQRVELYAAAPDAWQAEADMKRFWTEQRRVPERELEPHLHRLTNREAVEHLFAVACGVDSAVTGEPQILGQVREALRCGLEHGSMGRVLSVLFRRAITTGRRARTETGIGRSAASVGSAAAELARRSFGNLHSSRIALVGAGKVGELAVRSLLSKGAAEIALAGRTLERTEELARLCGSGVALTGLEDALRNCDVAITCTSAPHYVIRREMLQRVMLERGGQSLLLIDIAVPRDVEPAAGDIEGVRLLNIDDLASAVTANLNERKGEALKVAPIVEEEASAFERWLATQSAVPTIVALREQAEAIRRTELARTSAVLSRLPERDRRRIEALTFAMQKKLLHRTITLLRERAAGGDGLATRRAVRELFGLDEEKAFDGRAAEEKAALRPLR